MEEHAQELLDLQGQDQPVLQGKVQGQLDQACLALSIALLDHTLKGDLFDSTLVGFLAVLGVDPARQNFRDPYSYTSYLSGLVKMAQMLVALQAVRLAEDWPGYTPRRRPGRDARALLAVRGARPLWLDHPAAHVREENPEQHYWHGLYLLE
jgi:hypothetical protein